MEPETKANVAKASVIWAAVGISTASWDWTTLAAIAAFIYSCLLIIGWLFRHLVKPVWYWVKRRRK